MEGHVRGVQNKSKAPRERKDFLVNVFRGKLELLSGFLLSLSRDISLRPLPRHVIRCLLFRLNRLIDELSMCLSAPESIARLQRLGNYFQLVASVQAIAMRRSVHFTAINSKLISESRTCITAFLPLSAVICRDDDTNQETEHPRAAFSTVAPSGILKFTSYDSTEMQIKQTDLRAENAKGDARKAFIHMIT